MLFELYHENSKLSVWDWEALARMAFVNRSPELGAVGDLPPIDVDSLPPCMDLPRPRPIQMSLGDALLARRSVTELRPTALDWELLATILHASAGLTGSLRDGDEPVRPLRPHPSAGALYPISLAVEIPEETEMPAGVFIYDPVPHRLGRLPADLERIEQSVRQGPEHASCAGRIWLLCRFDRLTFKYGERGYRFALLEAGHIAQNLLLVATACGLSTRPYAGFFDHEVVEAMSLDQYALDPLYFVAIGAPVER